MTGAAAQDARTLTVVGAGLAGCEAAWQAARRGVDVTLWEMKPGRYSAAHGSPHFAELVCSNSLRSDAATHPAGLLKREMRRLGSLVMTAADETAVPAGRALAVDRAAFARRVSEAVESHPRIRVMSGAVERVPERGPAVIATGPLTDAPLARDLQALIGDETLYFYDALAPIVHADSIDFEVAFRASRYEEAASQQGQGDYLNLPLSEAEYRAFVARLVEADPVPLHRAEARLYFEGCLPIEEMARRGPLTLAYGPMKPVGLVDPRTGRRPFAVVQLRQEDKQGVLYNLVGFQTRLRIGDQKRILRGLPGLGEAVFARLGSVHRNTYVNAPSVLTPNLELRARPGVYVTGQLAGVEGYIESAGLGGLTGIAAAFAAHGRAAPPVPEETAHGALLRHLRESDPRHFQPMNVSFGLFPALEGGAGLRRRERQARHIERARGALEPYARAVEALTA